MRLIRVNEGDRVIGAELVEAEEDKDQAVSQAESQAVDPNGTQTPESETPAIEPVEETGSDNGNASEGEDS